MHSPSMHGKYKGAPQCPLRGVVRLGAKERQNVVMSGRVVGVWGKQQRKLAFLYGSRVSWREGLDRYINGILGIVLALQTLFRSIRF